MKPDALIALIRHAGSHLDHHYTETNSETDTSEPTNTVTNSRLYTLLEAISPDSSTTTPPSKKRKRSQQAPSSPSTSSTSSLSSITATATKPIFHLHTPQPALLTLVLPSPPSPSLKTYHIPPPTSWSSPAEILRLNKKVTQLWYRAYGASHEHRGKWTEAEILVVLKLLEKEPRIKAKDLLEGLKARGYAGRTLKSVEYLFGREGRVRAVRGLKALENGGNGKGGEGEVEEEKVEEEEGRVDEQVEMEAAVESCSALARMERAACEMSPLAKVSAAVLGAGFVSASKRRRAASAGGRGQIVDGQMSSYSAEDIEAARILASVGGTLSGGA